MAYNEVINNQQLNWSFKFDSLFVNVPQSTFYEECAAPVVKSVLDGYNGTILAYGQTGAGKTFTITAISENYAQRGIAPRAISHLFNEIRERSQFSYTVRVSYFEIHNESIYDLLNPTPFGIQPPDMSIVEDRNGSLIKGLSYLVASNEEEALNYLFDGETNRTVGTHALNCSSSRSHCIFTLHVECKSRLDLSGDVIVSKLCLVDLAGSERLSKTNSQGYTLREATFINKSLTFLEQVIIALADKKRDHVPYRQSKLTNSLRDSLGGNCNTVMIANIWGESNHVEETISTLKFATRMMSVRNEPVVNIQQDPFAIIKRKDKEIQELKQELAMQDALSGRTQSLDPLTDAQKAEFVKKIRGWIDGADDDVDASTLRHCKDLLSVCKQMFQKLGENFLRPEGEVPKPVEKHVQEDDGMVGDVDKNGFAIGLDQNERKRTKKKTQSAEERASPKPRPEKKKSPPESPIKEIKKPTKVEEFEKFKSDKGRNLADTLGEHKGTLILT